MMLKKVEQALKAMSSSRTIFKLFLLAHSVLLLMMLFTFPKINAKIETKAFDLRTFGYSVEDANLVLKNLDQATIDLYLFPQLFLLDIIYPFLIALFLGSLIVRLSTLTNSLQKGFLSTSFIFPFIAMIFDYFENALISIMIQNSSSVPTGIIKTASLFTQLKSGFTILSWLIIIGLTVVWIKNNLRK